MNVVTDRRRYSQGSIPHSMTGRTVGRGRKVFISARNVEDGTEKAAHMRLPGPTDVVRMAGQGYEAAERAMALVPRLVTIVADVEQVMIRVHALITGIHQTNERAAQLVDRTDAVMVRVEKVVATTEKLTGELAPLVDRLQPVLEKLEPMVAHLADTTSPAEVDAVVKLINTLPELSDKLQSDILPVLDTLGTVAPDLRDLLDASKQLNEMLGGLPGLGRIKRKIEDRQEAEDAQNQYRAAEAPPEAPARANGLAPAARPSGDGPSHL